jgi:bacterioferritin-associated ferredoxin
MVICHCRAVSDGLIRQEVDGGALDVETVVRRCGAGSACGGCRPAIALLLQGLEAPAA